MKWNNKFNYPKSSRSIEDGYRKYLLGDNKLPSVTTILSTTKSVLALDDSMSQIAKFIILSSN